MLSKFIRPLSPDTTWQYVGTAVGATAVLAGGVLMWRRYQERGLPPGPRPSFFSKDASSGSHVSIENEYHTLAKRYGDVFSLYVGNQLTIVLASHSAIKEAFVQHGDVFAARPPNGHNVLNFMDLKDDIFATPYQTEGWNQNKTFILGCLRSAGFGHSKGTEERILDQLENLFTFLEKTQTQGNKPINFRDLLPKVTLNIIFNVVFSKHFDFDDPALASNLDALRKFLACFNDTLLLDKYPIFISKIWYYKKVSYIKKCTDALREIIKKKKVPTDHFTSFDPENLRDFVDDYIVKRGCDDIPRLVENIMLLLPDATDTLALAVEWVILYITYHQDVQQKMLSEIEEVTGGNRNVTWNDRNSLPYTEAVIREVMRLRTPAGLTPAHAVTKETVFRGYRIPTNASVFALLYSALRDPQNYIEPDVFKPERFIDDKGDLIKSDAWIPFSMGRRKCIGEQVAQIEFFLITANLVQRFDFQFPPGEKPSLDPSGENIIHGPNPFSVVLTKRSQK